MDIKGIQMIYATKHESRNKTWFSYTTSINHKNEDEWDHDYYEVVFVKDAKGYDIPDKTKIDIKDGFLSCRSYIDKGGEKKIISQMIVQNFDYVEEPTENDVKGYSKLNSEDIPF